MSAFRNWPETNLESRWVSIDSGLADWLDPLATARAFHPCVARLRLRDIAPAVVHCKAHLIKDIGRMMMDIEELRCHGIQIKPYRRRAANCFSNFSPSRLLSTVRLTFTSAAVRGRGMGDCPELLSAECD
jgi:hypothetical protein